MKVGFGLFVIYQVIQKLRWRTGRKNPSRTVLKKIYVLEFNFLHIFFV